MKFLKRILVPLTAIIFITACQKQLSFDVDGTARGSLKSAATGDCLPSTINGIFKADSLLDNTNFIDVQVNIATTGTYDIKSDTVNGYSFRGTGTLGIAGTNTVRLYGSGKPLVSGSNVFTIKFDLSSCIVNVTVISSTTGPASYSLDGSPGSCSGAITSGTYTPGTVLGINNTVMLTINVTDSGTYQLIAGPVNGILFSSTGVFTDLGPQSVTLNGTGTPLVAGAFNFPVGNGTDTCSFSINVGGIVPNEDYVPETAFSNWSYKYIGGAPTDTFYQHVNPNTILINTITYKIFESKDIFSTDSFYHRKDGGKYYNIFDDVYHGFDTAFNVDGLILDSNLAVNASWVVDLGSNTFLGVPATGKVTCTILAKGATATIAGITYTNIIKVKYEYSHNTGTGDIIQEEDEVWYAKGIGVIHSSYIFFYPTLPPASAVIFEITRSQIF